MVFIGHKMTVLLLPKFKLNQLYNSLVCIKIHVERVLLEPVKYVITLLAGDVRLMLFGNPPVQCLSTLTVLLLAKNKIIR